MHMGLDSPKNVRSHLMYVDSSQCYLQHQLDKGCFPRSSTGQGKEALSRHMYVLIL